MLSRRTQSGAASNERQAADIEYFVDMRSVQNGTQNCERRTTADIVDGSAPNGASGAPQNRRSVTPTDEVSAARCVAPGRPLACRTGRGAAGRAAG